MIADLPLARQSGKIAYSTKFDFFQPRKHVSFWSRLPVFSQYSQFLHMLFLGELPSRESILQHLRLGHLLSPFVHVNPPSPLPKFQLVINQATLPGGSSCLLLLLLPLMGFGLAASHAAGARYCPFGIPPLTETTGDIWHSAGADSKRPTLCANPHTKSRVSSQRPSSP